MEFRLARERYDLLLSRLMRLYQGLLMPLALGFVAVSTAAADPVTDAEIDRTLAPLVEAVDRVTVASPPAATVDDLQSQVRSLLNSPEIRELYQDANRELNEMAEVTSNPGPFGLSNFGDVIPGVFRAANPTMKQAGKLVASGRVDHIVALNIELQSLTRMDPGEGAPLTGPRRKAIREALLQRGKSRERTDREIEFYEEHLEYAQAITRDRLAYGSFYPLNDPRVSIGGFLDALRKVVQLRREGKKVLIHCSIGKHRTGLLSMLLRSLESKGEVTPSFRQELYREFVRRNWSEWAETYTQYAIVLPMILRSTPYQEIAQ